MAEELLKKIRDLRKENEELKGIIKTKEDDSKTFWTLFFLFSVFVVCVLILWSFLGRDLAFGIGGIVMTIFIIWVIH